MPMSIKALDSDGNPDPTGMGLEVVGGGTFNGVGVSTQADVSTLNGSIAAAEAAASSALTAAEATIASNLAAAIAAEVTARNTAIAAAVAPAIYTVATLPAAPASGTRAFVSDASGTPAFLGTPAGSGSTMAPVFWNGTAWKYG